MPENPFSKLKTPNAHEALATLDLQTPRKNPILIKASYETPVEGLQPASETLIQPRMSPKTLNPILHPGDSIFLISWSRLFT